MGYENLNILRSYKTKKNDIVREFYVPILTQSVLYKRAVGFFSSTALIELSKGISGLIKNVFSDLKITKLSGREKRVPTVSPHTRSL